MLIVVVGLHVIGGLLAVMALALIMAGVGFGLLLASVVV